MNIRAAAITALDRILNHGHKADDLLNRDMIELEDVRDRHFLHELVYGVLRRFFTLEADFSRFLKQKPEDSARFALFIGSYQLRYMRVPTHAAVGETVEAVKGLDARASGMVNAVLRRVADAEPPARFKPYQRSELPQWMFASWRDAFGVEAVEAIAAVHPVRPDLCVAVFEDRSGWMQQAVAAGFDVREGARSACAVLLPGGTDVAALPGYDTGAFTVMDQAAQYAALALDVQPGERVLDLCAAPGGKTALLARMHPDAEVIAVELSERRIPRLQENLARLKTDNVTIQQGDATALPFEDDYADAILLDAPCTASGVIRRHPDAKFIHDAASVARHAALQKKMLAEALRVLRPGGRLVYAVCSIHPQENEQVVEGFTGLQSSERLFPSETHDGFFIARFVK